MSGFFYVYILVSEETKPSTIPALQATLSSACGNTIEGHARIQRQIGRGESKSQLHSNLKAKPVLSKNISRTALVGSLLDATFDSFSDCGMWIADLTGACGGGSRSWRKSFSLVR
jgi:hypothetical protein